MQRYQEEKMKSEIRRIVRKLAMLSALVVSLVVLNSGLPQAHAYAIGFCCSVNCEEMLENCYTSCGCPAPSACLTFCENRYNRCVFTECDPSC
jgi:hypothetical protein